MKFIFVTCFLLLTLPAVTHAENGLISIKSAFDVNTTSDRLVRVLTDKGMTVFSRIRHSDSANQVGVALAPTQLIIFGNPKVGSPLMACQQSIAIDLPQKALISQDENNNVWLTYNSPGYLAARHKVSGCAPQLAKIDKALATFAQQATQPDSY